MGRDAQDVSHLYCTLLNFNGSGRTVPFEQRKFKIIAFIPSPLPVTVPL